MPKLFLSKPLFLKWRDRYYRLLASVVPKCRLLHCGDSAGTVAMPRTCSLRDAVPPWGIRPPPTPCSPSLSPQSFPLAHLLPLPPSRSRCEPPWLKPCPSSPPLIESSPSRSKPTDSSAVSSSPSPPVESSRDPRARRHRPSLRPRRPRSAEHLTVASVPLRPCRPRIRVPGEHASLLDLLFPSSRPSSLSRRSMP